MIHCMCGRKDTNLSEDGFASFYTRQSIRGKMNGSTSCEDIRKKLIWFQGPTLLPGVDCRSERSTEAMKLWSDHNT